MQLFRLSDKKDYLGLQRVRWAKYFGVPITEGFPKGFPFRTLPVQRALCAISRKAPEKLPAAIAAVYKAVWVDGDTTVGDVDGFVPLFESVLGKQETQEILVAVSVLQYSSRSQRSSLGMRPQERKEAD
jgi:2-hydroxychromene-2-carboxylate isomerase